MITATQRRQQITVLERGWLSSNNILFKGLRETALVDSGYATHAQQTLALVMTELGTGALDCLLNTHLHSDHCGGNSALQQKFPRLRTYIPPGEAVAVEHWDQSMLSYVATGQQCPRFGFEGLLMPGQQIALGDSRWEIHSAPGHDPHSVILFEPTMRLLISADALWERGFGVVFPELSGEPSFDEVAATLDMIERLAPCEVIPGHGRPFTDVSAALGAARQRLEILSKNPPKHARHAIKVLLKFKLLESQSLSLHDWQNWTERTPLLESIRRRFFRSDSRETLVDSVLQELVTSNLAAVNGANVLNI